MPIADAVDRVDLDPILKEFYLGPIIESLNSQIEMVQLFTKATLDWSGRRVVIPVHVSRNSGTSYLAEGAALPDPGKQDYVNLHVQAKYLYGRFRLTGQAIATAKTNANSFATYVQSEMDRLVTDVKVKANQAMFTGQGCVGFIWEHYNLLVGGAGATAATQTFNFSGDKAHMRALQTQARAVNPPGTNADVLKCDVIRLDTYSTALETPGAGNATIACDATAGNDAQVTLNAATLGPAAVANDALRLNGGGAAFPSNAELRDNTACLLVVNGQGALTLGGGSPFLVETVHDNSLANTIPSEQMGLYGNLCLQTHFAVDRNKVLIGGTSVAQATTARPAEGGNHELRAADVGTNPAVLAGSGVVAADPLDFERMQAMLDEIMIQGGDNPDCIYMHPIMRQKYAAALLWTAAGANAGNLYKDVNAGIGKGDPGFSSYAFSGIPIKVSRHCGKGLAIFLNTKVWTVAELQAFGMADLDGNVISRRPGYDEWEGFIRWYYDLVCKNPNRNAVLVGIQFAT